jgi:hypothetical protein
MPTVEIWSDRGRDQVVTLVEPSYLVGSDGDSVDLVLVDATVSRVHAVLERVGRAWLVRDLGSRNGTRVGSDRLTGQRRLHHGDEVILGRTRLVFLDTRDGMRPATDSLAPAPDNLTRMERRVLVELCRPLVSHQAFQPPASVREIAARLFIGRNAVQAHLSNLYDKFGIGPNADESRRVLLANEAVQRGAVTRADLDDRGGPRA